MAGTSLLRHLLVIAIDLPNIVRALLLLMLQVSVPLHLIDHLATIQLADVILVFEAHLLKARFFA